MTRTQAETVLIARCGKLLTACGIDGATVNGTNASLTDPLAWAMRQSGYSPAAFGAVTDTDLAGVAADDTDKLLDLAEFKALDNGLGNFDATDISVGPRSESYDQIRTGVEKILNRKQASITRLYGFGLGTLDAGVISYDFMAKGSDKLT